MGVTGLGVQRAGPLSFGQERLWFLDQMAKDSCAYNIPLAIRLKGHLDVEALVKSIRQLEDRHEGLRTVFRVRPDGPTQLVLNPGLLDVGLVDMSRTDNRAHQAAIAAEASTPIDLDKGPAWRCQLIRTQVDEWILLITFHHLIADQWSIGTFFQELALLYTTATNSGPELAPVRWQPLDHAMWQRDQWSNGGFSRDFHYWQSQLERAPDALEFLTDRPRPPIQTFVGAHLEFKIPREEAAGLRAMARANGATLFMILSAVFAAVLHRHSGQTDLALGFAIANRVRPESERMFGYLVNTLPLRLDLTANPTFLELVQRVRQTAIGAYDHQEIPFELLVQELRPKRSLSTTPFFQATIGLSSPPASALALPGVNSVREIVETRTSKFDLALNFRDLDGDLISELSYNTALFDMPRMQRLTDHCVSLCRTAAFHPEVRIDDAAMVNSRELRHLSSRLAGTTRTVEYRPLVELVGSHARTKPGATALESGGQITTYGQLEEASDRLARRLGKVRVTSDSIVGLLLQRSAVAIEAAYAVMKAGAAFLPLDPSLPDARLRFMLEDAGVRVVVTSAALASRAVGWPETIVVAGIGDETLEGRPREWPPSPQSSLAYLIYTSGSTGVPKAVAIEHRGLSNLVAWCIQRFEIDNRDRATWTASPSFDASIFEVWPYLAAGACVAIAGSEPLIDPRRLRDWLLESGATIAHITTPLAEGLLELEWPPTCRLRILLTGGDRLRRLPGPQMAFKLHNNYGPTECSVIATSGEVKGDAIEAPPIGRPITGTTVHLLDNELMPVPIGAAGHLFVGGVGVARGYLNRPSLTAERFIPDPWSPNGERMYATGDIARFREDGSLGFLGRGDDQVKVRGFRVELPEIEAAFLACPGVKEAVVGTEDDPSGSSRLVALLVAIDEKPPSIHGLRELLRRQLPEYMIPSRIQWIDSVPRTATGKLDRRSLLRDTPPSVNPPERVPLDALEMSLLGIWEDVLGNSQIGPDDDFFDSGGHSLLAVRLVSRIEERFAASLSLTDFFAHPTVAQMAQRLREPSTAAASGLVQLSSGEGGTPIILLPPIGGNLFAYRDLVRVLKHGRSVFGLQARGVNAGEVPLDDLLAMCDAFSELASPLCRTGPCVLAGWSFGGILAYETACSLERADLNPSAVLLFDARPRTVGRPAPLDTHDAILDFVAEALPPGIIPSGADKVSAAELVQAIAAESTGADRSLSRGAFSDAVQRLISVYVGNRRALARHSLRPYGGDLVVFAPRDGPGFDGQSWSTYCSGSVRTVRVGGSHQSMLRKGHVTALAAKVDQAVAGSIRGRDVRVT